MIDTPAEAWPALPWRGGPGNSARKWHLATASMLDQLSALSTSVIVAAAAVHLVVFLGLKIRATADWRQLASVLEDFTRELKHRSVLDQSAPLPDQVDAFLADIRDVVDDSSRQADRVHLLQRVRVIDEKRRYLDSLWFATIYNMARTMIEAYPLAGVLGTILAIGAALQTAGGQDTVTVGVIVARFGDAIWSTFAGLVAAIVLMFVHSSVEAGFARLTEARLHVREAVARAKRELALLKPVSPGTVASGLGHRAEGDLP